jgi:membrane-bound lytic murein transglycosylase D|tara:strand:- start:2081 stop:3307 length:1227 start_codon:yes stop_codon:yes gene_type:complete
MNKQIIFFLLSVFSFIQISAQTDTIIINVIPDSTLVDFSKTIEIDTTLSLPTSQVVIIKEVNPTVIDKSLSEKEKIIAKRMYLLDQSSPMDFTFNDITSFYIDRYLTRDVKLVSRMLGISSLYFPMMEQQLDRFQIPLELKYLAIVESALNPKARSRSGATGLWQFMYATGKEYNLNVTSYIDERQNPLKSTIAACEYFQVLYSIFGDWNLVLAAYNGGPGYLKRVMAKTELSDYWDLRPHLRKETQGYVPKFIALTYAMTFYKEHNIEVFDSNIKINERDTFSFQQQVPYYLLSDMFCVDVEILNYLNPSFKSELLPKGDVICLPKEVIMDIVVNENHFYDYLLKVESKEILVNEIRLVYIVKKGDYLGKISKQYKLSISEIKKWNKLHSDNLSIGDKLILYISDEN